MWETRVAAEVASAERPIPTADFIAAAMKSQASASIEVRYSLGGLKYHYIRTPEALSMTETYSDSGDVKQSSYDFSARETKTLTTKEDGTRTGTVLRPWLGDPFHSPSLLDPVLFVVPWGAEWPRPLYERISSGVVLPEQEEIDGHPCWRVDMTQPTNHKRCSIWVDPDVGFSPRRIEIVPTNEDKGPSVISFKEYKELAPGIWYAMKQVSEFSTSLPEGTTSVVLGAGGDSSKSADTGPITWRRMTHTRTASEASTGKSFSKSSLLVEFPSGTKVFVNHAYEPIIVP